MKAKWTVSRGAGIKYEWNGYTIVSATPGIYTSGVYRWWVIQGQPAPSKDKFEYLNDAKEACEVAHRMEAE